MFANADAGGSFPPMVGWVSGRPGEMPHRIEQPTFRMLEHGDVIMVEIEGRWGGYASQIDQTVAIGAATPELRAAMELNFAAFSRTLQMIKPGVTVREVASAAQLTGLGGRARVELNLQGRGTGDDGPLVASTLGPSEALDVVIEEHCCLLLKPNVRLDGATGHFCRWGDSIAITRGGAVRLGTRPQELPVL
jgi:Xaa-Pro dipeptidase